LRANNPQQRPSHHLSARRPHRACHGRLSRLGAAARPPPARSNSAPAARLLTLGARSQAGDSLTPAGCHGQRALTDRHGRQRPVAVRLYVAARAPPAPNLTDTCADTFTGFLDTPYDANHSLLTDVESQSIADFFTNTDPFTLADPNLFPHTADSKDSVDDFASWGSFVTPATVHGVSTTIPDQAHLHSGFFNDHSYPQPPPPLNHLGNTHDDLQAASTLYHNSQSSYSNNNNSNNNNSNNNRTHSFHGMSTSDRPESSNGVSNLDSNGKPMIITPHGPINEQLAALIPNHNQQGTLDAQFAAQWVGTNAIQMYEDELERPNLKRSYTFGTDESFNNPTGYSGSLGQEGTDQVTHRMMHPSQSSSRTMGANGVGNPSEHRRLHTSQSADLSEDERSDEATSDEDEDEKPSKKRRKSRPGRDVSRKVAKNGKSRVASAAEESNKRKRASAAQKLQRENLTEEQKRSNHILSEQKRRNLIKRGFDDLHDLVPEIRNGGLSKSSVLTEAANFLEKMIEDNKAFKQLAAG
jgi:hypothetical protein